MSTLPKTLDEALAIIEEQRRELANQAVRIEKLEARAGSEINDARLNGRPGLLGLLAPRLRGRISREDWQAIMASGLFDEEFYRAEIAGRRDGARALKAPLKHYLTVGGFEGLDPSSGFDSDWYLTSNPDVNAVGVNPLVHYVRYGQWEGRLPCHGATPGGPRGLPVTSTAFRHRMWAGFSHIALPELEVLADDGLNSRAAWYLASWCYAHGDLDIALDRVEQSITNSPSGANRRALIGLSKCYTLLQERAGLEAVVEEHEAPRQIGNVYPYVYANLVNCRQWWAEWPTAINQVFYRVGMMGISLGDLDRGASLDNLVGEREVTVGDQVVIEKENSGTLPLASVVVPAYNAGSTLPIALDGLLAQSWPALEIIVVDDGSTDNTAEVARAYAERDSRVRYLPNPNNIGAYPSRNNGMRAARGEFVTVHDSDDWSHPQKLERQLLPLLNDPSKIATFSSWVRVTADMRFVGPWLLSEEFVEKNHSSAVMRRSVLDEIGYWDEVNVAGDTEFLWRLEHNYGHHRIVHVLPTTPLSFALADDTSLTRAKATHVKTIHYGLRRIYREAARWWHQCRDGKPVLPSSSLAGDESGSLRTKVACRPFPVPLGIVRGAKTQFDRVLVGNFAVDGEQLTSVLEAIQQEVDRGGELCLFHWPSYTEWHGAAIAGEVFELCHKKGLNFAHMGLTVEADTVVILDASLWEYPPTQAVRIEGLKQVATLGGEQAEPQSELLAYFLQGGVQVTSG